MKYLVKPAREFSFLGAMIVDTVELAKARLDHMESLHNPHTYPGEPTYIAYKIYSLEDA